MGWKEIKEKLKWLDPFTYMDLALGFIHKKGINYKLLENKSVESASYYVDHPDNDECIFTIKTVKTADAKEVLDSAMAECKKEVSDFNKQVLALMSEISTSKKKSKKK